MNNFLSNYIFSHHIYKQLSNLRGFQQRLFWKKFRVKPQTEMLHETMIRLARKIKDFEKLSGWIDIDLMQRQLVHEWAGHVARLPTWRPGCLTSRILEWRDRNWLDEIAIKEGSQMHGRRLRVWRWEEQVSNKFGGDWRKTAKDKDAWNRLGPVYWETGASSRVWRIPANISASLSFQYLCILYLFSTPLLGSRLRFGFALSCLPYVSHSIRRYD